MRLPSLGPGPGRAPRGEVTAHRWRVSMATLAAVEHRAPQLPGRWVPARMLAHGRTALAESAHGVPAHVRAASGRTEARPVWALTGADAVQVGKFDVDHVVRLRAFYGARGVSLRLQGGGEGRSDGIARAVRAHQDVRRYAPDLVPDLLGHGRILRGRVAYLLEETVEGAHPRGQRELLEVLEHLAGRLHAVHQGVGISHQHLSHVLGEKFPARWQQLVADGTVDGVLASAVQHLLRRDALLEVSLGHGDLVTSNIMLVQNRPVLIDWEYAGSQPIVFDLAKVHINSGRTDDAVTALRRGLGDVGTGLDHYSLEEQLALAHIRLLSWYPARRARAAAAGRLHQLDRQAQRRLRVVRHLLALD